MSLPLHCRGEPWSCAGAEFIRDIDILYLTLLTSPNPQILGLDRRVLAAWIEAEILRQGVVVEGSYSYGRGASMLVVEINAVSVGGRCFHLLGRGGSVGVDGAEAAGANGECLAGAGYRRGYGCGVGGCGDGAGGQGRRAVCRGVLLRQLAAAG